MTDDGHAPTIPDTQAPTHGPSSTGIPKAPDTRYALRALLGKGGMGEVWLAHDTRIDRDIAVKLMRGSKDPDAVARFLREARVQGRLEHPSVVPVHDLGGDDTAPFFAMKRLTGTTLADVIAARDLAKWPRRTLLARFVDICLAIEFAHKRGVIHRDLKPANIMLGDYGETYVLDWGLARIVDDSDSGVIRNSDLRGDSVTGTVAGQTEAGEMLGTPGYMAPEQMRGEPVDQRSDVYALGCMLFELLVGEPAIPRDRTFELTLSSLCHRPLERSPDVPPELDEICARATQADPAKRFASARELADGIQRFLDGDRDLERRRELAAAHVLRAREVLAHDTIESRAEAMREAGSAIALDASNRDAQSLLARLLLEPPKQIPPAALHKLADERLATIRTTSRLGALMYASFLAMIPIAKLLGIAQTWPLLVLAGLLGVLITVTALAGTGRVPLGRPVVMIIVVTHMTLLASVGMFLGPLLILPILLFGSMPIMVMAPTVYMPKTIVALHLLAVAVPLSLEWLGILPASYHLVGGTLVLDPWAVDIAPRALTFAVLATIVAQLLANAVLLNRQRQDQERAQELLHVQKWQLEQLVPSSGSSS
jgi:eukaryotic-like serine/threonine-protein kinase